VVVHLDRVFDSKVIIELGPLRIDTLDDYSADPEGIPETTWVFFGSPPPDPGPDVQPGNTLLVVQMERLPLAPGAPFSEWNFRLWLNPTPGDAPGTMPDLHHNVPFGFEVWNSISGILLSAGNARGDSVNTGFDEIRIGDSYRAVTARTHYNLNLNLVGSGGGNVTIHGLDTDWHTSGNGVFPIPVGTSIRLSASPRADSDFEAFSGGCSGVCEFIMNSDRTVDAEFVLETSVPRHPLKITVNGPGQLRAPPERPDRSPDYQTYRDATATLYYPEGADMELQAVQDGSATSTILWDNSATVPERSIEMDGSKEVTLEFVPRLPDTAPIISPAPSVVAGSIDLAYPSEYGRPAIDRRDSLDPDSPWTETSADYLEDGDMTTARIPTTGLGGIIRAAFRHVRPPLFSGIDNAAWSERAGFLSPGWPDGVGTEIIEHPERPTLEIGPWTLAEVQTYLDELYDFVENVAGLADDLRAAMLANILLKKDDLDDFYPTPPNPPSDITCGDGAGCYTVLHVDGGAADGGDGSIGNPFKTIGQANAHAGDISACGVEIQLAPGTYVENLETSRHVRLVGGATRPVIKGSLRNGGPHKLTLKEIEIHGDPFDPTVFVPANSYAIYSGDPCGYLDLDHVRILNSAGPGVWVQQGRLYARELVVDGSAGRLSGFADGTGDGWGVFIESGAHAVLDGIELTRNRVGGLLAKGQHTQVHAQRLSAHHNSWTAFHGDGVVLVWRGASLLLECASFSENENAVSLMAADRSKVFGRLIRIVDQFPRPCGGVGGPCEGFAGGIGFGSYAAQMDIAVFNIVRAAFIGIQLAVGGEMDLKNGVITGCLIGINAQTDTDFDLGRLMDRVVYIDNETTFDAPRLPVPGL